MDRRRFLLTSLAGAFAAPLAAQAQQAAPTRVARIGYLDALKPHDLYEALRLGLRDLGYTEGHNIIIEQRWAEGRWERLPSLAAELVRLNVDLIVASVPSVVRAARNATGQIPIVVVLGGDPVEQGLIDSLARPGSNVTGLASNAFEIVPKQLELLKEVFPKVSRVAVLQNPDAAIPYPVRRAEDAARTLAVRHRERSRSGRTRRCLRGNEPRAGWTHWSFPLKRSSTSIERALQSSPRGDAYRLSTGSGSMSMLAA
jgi:putative ABC transport system substrate-binding protein